ncbi:MAG: M15 family metallopeptidase [Longimicrobiales bacterium]
MRRLLLLLALPACVAQPPASAPADAPATTAALSLEALTADYADGADTLSLLERDGELRLLPWGGSELALDRISDTLWMVGPGDTVRLAARAFLVRGGRSFERLALGPADGTVFRIEPLRPPGELLAEALAARPPEEEGDFLESDLAELVALDPTIRLDVRYATTENFMGEVFYSQPRAFLQRPAAEALVRAHRWLLEQGYGLTIYDGYRPWYVTKMFWDATPTHLREFVANPARGSRHNRGCAVDLTLFDAATGRAVEMPSGYDEFSPRAYADYPGGTSERRGHRALLREAMEAQGFTANPSEWWHFDYGDWRRYRLANQRFEELGSRAGA